MAFCGAEVHRGFDEVAELLRLAEVVARSDLVITGEGSLDAQTLEKKRSWDNSGGGILYTVQP